MIKWFKQSFIGVLLKRARNKFTMGKWSQVAQGVPLPRPEKYKILQTYRTQHGLSVLVETGTYLGDTMETFKDDFQSLYSIELDRQLWQKADSRFTSFPHIQILHGDSTEVLPKLLPQLQEGVLFWLDGHYSEGFTAKGDINTPILNEIRAIFASGLKKYVILIDDARLFTGRNDYPTIGQVESLFRGHDHTLHFEVKDDIIRVFP